MAAQFNFLKKYIVVDKRKHYERQNPQFKHTFYKLDIANLLEAEHRLGFTFPSELEAFYQEIGYGFMHRDMDSGRYDRFMSPDDVASVYLREDQYEADPDLEIFDDPDQLIFFAVIEGIYLTLDLKVKGEQSPVYYFDDKIADSIEEFMRKYDENPDFLDEFDDDEA